MDRHAPKRDIVEMLVTDYLLNNAGVLPRRWIRWMASYYPDARVRRVCWKLTNVEMGEGTYANIGMLVVDEYASGDVLLKIGCNVSIAPGVMFVAQSIPNNSKKLQSHPYVSSKLIQRKQIVVGDDVWIGAHVTILPGVHIGNGSIIGAGAVVNRDVPDHAIVAGVPAKVIRILSEEETP